MGSLFFSSDFGAADKLCQVEHPTTPKSSSLGQVRRRHQRHIRDHATEWPRSQQPPRSSQLTQGSFKVYNAKVQHFGHTHAETRLASARRS